MTISAIARRLTLVIRLLRNMHQSALSTDSKPPLSSSMTSSRGPSFAAARETPQFSSGESARPDESLRDAEAPRDTALDGLRAIAILLVVAHNAGSVAGPLDGPLLRAWALVSNAGWTGVQLFFALSGFLITRILLDNRGIPGAMKSFYVRRALRIVPLYFATLLVLFYLVPHVPALSAISLRGPRSTLWYWFYLSNWVAPFGGLAIALPHVWSLAVEEQFYLVWPFVVGALTARSLLLACGILVVGSLCVRIGLHAVYPEHIASAAAYKWTVARFDALAMGALVAIVQRNARGRAFLQERLGAIATLSLTALVLVAVIGHGLPPEGIVTECVTQPLSGFVSALAVFALIAPNREKGSPFVVAAHRLMSSRPLERIGRYSYALYLFHLPLHLLLYPYAVVSISHGTPTSRFAVLLAYTGCVLGLSLTLAKLSWVCIERPFLSLKRHFPMPRAARSLVPG